MSWLRVFFSRLLASLAGRRRDHELNDEIQDHLDQLAENHLRACMSLHDARLAARRDFGGLDQVKEVYRDQRGLPLVEAAIQDLRYAFRQLRGNPAFTAVAISTLALGIGAVTAIFSIVDAVMLRPLTYWEADRLLAVHEVIPKFGRIPINGHHFRVWRQETRSFESLAIVGGISVNVIGSGEPERLPAGRVSASLFPMIGIRAQLGRTFTDEEDQPGRDDVVILNDELWRRRFGADPGVIGQTIVLDERPYEIVDVLPADFHFETLRPL